MSKINSAISFSDLHLGREFSYLNSKMPQFQKNKNALVELLQKLGPKDEIIINGDFLEYSFASFDVVFREVKEFFTLLADGGQYKKIVYIPGNHDHHFWRILGEQVHVYGKLIRGIDPPNYEKYPSCFVDERFSSADPNLPCEIVLEHLWPNNNSKPEIVVKYPHHLVRIKSDGNKETVYLFTHGHFLEDLFKVVNFLIEPAHLQELEAFNNMWLELLCYHIGHAGSLSKRIRDLEKKFGERDRQVIEDIKILKRNIYESLKKKLKLKWYEALGVKWGLNRIVKKIGFKESSGLYKAPLDDKLKKSIEEYLKKFVLQRYQKGKAKEYFFPCDSDIPKPFTFVFGHTHRPIKGKPEEIMIDEKIYPIMNTGGWLRTDTEKPDGDTAGLIVVDQEGIRWESLEGKLE